jgi:hypothetical protein
VTTPLSRLRVTIWPPLVLRVAGDEGGPHAEQGELHPQHDGGDGAGGEADLGGREPPGRQQPEQEPQAH